MTSAIHEIFQDAVFFPYSYGNMEIGWTILQVLLSNPAATCISMYSRYVPIYLCVLQFVRAFVVTYTQMLHRPYFLIIKKIIEQLFEDWICLSFLLNMLMK